MNFKVVFKVICFFKVRVKKKKKSFAGINKVTRAEVADVLKKIKLGDYVIPENKILWKWAVPRLVWYFLLCFHLILFYLLPPPHTLRHTDKQRASTWAYNRYVLCFYCNHYYNYLLDINSSAPIVITCTPRINVWWLCLAL